jgi:two-component system, OmpR family, sensor histidine kinase QseC
MNKPPALPALQGQRQAPSLSWRVVWVVLAGFVVVFVVLLAWIGYSSLKRESGEFDRAMLRAAQGLATALDEIDSPVGVHAALAMFNTLVITQTNVDHDGEPLIDVVSVRRDGTQKQSGRLAPQQDLRELRDGVVQQTVDQRNLRYYVASSQHWHVALIDESDQRSAWALRLLARELLMYLAAALPIVLVPVWFTVRAALGPLRRLSDHLAQRRLQDSRPLAPPTPYREFVPLENSLNLLFERIGAGLAREKAFVNDAAHEMRTPLAVISTQAHLLAASDGPAREQARLRLQAAIERASHLTQQLLRLAQADSATAGTHAELDVMDLARDALAAFAPQAASQQSELILEGPDQLVVRTDRHALRSILDNLIDNALRYGGPAAVVQVRVCGKGARWQLWVADDGPGMTPAQRERAFERFWRGAQDHSRGAGLGLAIVQEMARALGGQVHLEDGLGQGTRKGCAVVLRLA